MIKLIVKTAVLSVVMLTLMSLLSHQLDTFFTTRFKDEKPFWFFNKSQGRYDFAVLGSSRAENMIDIPTIEKAVHQKGINLSMQGTGHAGLYLILKGFVERDNQIRSLLIQVDEYSLDSQKSYINAFPVHAYLPYFSDKNIRQVIEERSERSKFRMWQYVPFSRYVDYNNYYLTYCLNYYLGKRKYDYDKGRGSVLEGSTETYQFDYNKYRLVNRKIDKDDVIYLLKILEYARSKGISVAMFTAPQYYRVLPFLNTRDESRRVFEDISKRLEVPYLNYEDDDMCKNRAYFHDNTHLNDIGSIAFTKKLSADLRDVLEARN